MLLPCRKRHDGTKVLLACLLAALVSSVPGRAGADDRALEKAADIGAVALPAAAAGITALHGDREGAGELGKALLSTVAATAGLKLSIRKRAPNGDNHSFPSGHTSVAFAGASYLQRRYGWGYGVPSYLAASFVGASRVGTDHHRVRDVLAGAGIGYLSNVIFTARYGGVSAAPLIAQDCVGVVLWTSFR